jgi:hypothetical protein
MLGWGTTRRGGIELAGVLLVLLVIVGLAAALLSGTGGNADIDEGPAARAPGVVVRGSPACVPSAPPAAGVPKGPVEAVGPHHSPGGTVVATRSSSEYSTVGRDASGAPWFRARVTTDARLAARSRRELAGTELEPEVLGGTRRSYAAVLPAPTPEDELPPTPLDPLALPEGGSVVLAPHGGHGVGVLRLPANQVRVLSGPAAVLLPLLADGPVPDTASRLAGDPALLEALGSARIEQADYTVETSSGRVAYYREVLTGGRPTVDGNGVSNLAVVGRAGASSALPARLAPFAAQLDGSTTVLTSYDDGRVAVAGPVPAGPVGIVLAETVDASGRFLHGTSVAELRAPRASATSVSAFNEEYAGARRRVRAPHDLLLRFDSRALSRLLTQAETMTSTPGPGAAAVRDRARLVRRATSPSSRLLAVVAPRAARGEPAGTLTADGALTGLAAWQSAYEGSVAQASAVPGPDDEQRLAGPGTTTCRPAGVS